MNAPAMTFNHSPILIQRKRERGAVLVISLVMLTILTVIALGTMTDTNLQSNMARNSQISLRAFNLSLSELKAQFNASKDNNEMNGAPYLDTLADIHQTQDPFTIPQNDLVMAGANNPFQQIAVIRFVREGHCGGGNEIGGSGLIFEMDSTSEFRIGNGSGINSDQSFGLCYPNPNDQ